jgi:hypothetical protein
MVFRVLLSREGKIGVFVFGVMHSILIANVQSNVYFLIEERWYRVQRGDVKIAMQKIGGLRTIKSEYSHHLLLDRTVSVFPIKHTKSQEGSKTLSKAWRQPGRLSAGN